MALLLMDGFEFAPNFRSAYGGTGVATAATGRDGVGKSMVWSNPAIIGPPSPVSTLILGVGIWIGSSGFNTGFVFIFGDANGTQHLSIGTDAAGHVTVSRASTVLGTGPTVIGASTWHWVEIKCTIADAGGICIVKLDGNTEINFTGDTKNAGTLSTISNIRTQSGITYRYDDLVMCDATGSAPFNDFFGEKVIRLKAPNGNGATSQWVGSDGNSTDNYALVDEIPVSSTDYTGSATPGDRDLYALSNVTGFASVDAIQNSAYAAKSDAGARSFKTVTRNSGGSVTASSAVALSTTYQLLPGGIEQTDPAGAAWTTTSVNTIQTGVECV